jgi:TolA-binding protein
MNRPDRIDETFACLRKTDAPIDDLHSARVWIAIDQRLRERHTRPRWLRIALPLAAVGTLCLWIGTWLLVRHLHRPALDWADATTTKTSVQPKTPLPGGPGVLEVISPYLVSGTAPSRLLDGQHHHVEVPAGGLLRASLASRARISLLGPAELSVLSVGDTSMVLSLHHGILLCDYQHQDGHSLHVRSPGAETKVVGTLFSIEVAGTNSTISVTRGSVDVEARGQTVRVPEGHRLPAKGQALETLGGPVTEQLAEHETALLPPQGDTGVLSVVAETDGKPIWMGGRWLGIPPLSARLPSGQVALLVGQAHPSMTGHSSMRRIETLILPGKTAVALIDGELAEKTDRARPIGHKLTTSQIREPGHATTNEETPRETPPSEKPLQENAADQVAEETAAMLYERAEAAMKKGEKNLARRTLQTLVDRFPNGESATSARYEIARMAFAAGDWEDAQRGLDQLQKRQLSPALTEPVHYLRCRVKVARADRRQAMACLAEFRTVFPESPHDAEMLSLLASFLFEEKCTTARPLLDEYLRRYPQGPFAKEAQKRRQHCQP